MFLVVIHCQEKDVIIQKNNQHESLFPIPINRAVNTIITPLNYFQQKYLNLAIISFDYFVFPIHLETANFNLIQCSRGSRFAKTYYYFDGIIAFASRKLTNNWNLLSSLSQTVARLLFKTDKIYDMLRHSSKPPLCIIVYPVSST